MKKWISGKWWSISVGLSIAALLYLRLAEAGNPIGSHWTKLQYEDRSMTATNPKMRYLCVEDMAFDLGEDGERLDPLEDKIAIADAEAKKLCLPPWAPALEDAKTLMSSASPESGWGATLVEIDAEPPAAVEAMGEKLERYGWRETRSSSSARQKNPSLSGAMYEMGRAWLLTVAYVRDETNKSAVLVAGTAEPRPEVLR